MNYIPDKYWGSSRHPILLQELSENITNFSIDILEYINDPQNLTKREEHWQRKFQVVEDIEYYNLTYANTKFNTTGMRAYHDSNTLKYGLFPPNKIPAGWIKGRKPKNIRGKSKSKTGFKKGDPKLEKIRSESNKRSAKKGLDNKSTKIWLLKDPNNNLHRIIGLAPFCKKNNLLQPYNIIHPFQKNIDQKSREVLLKDGW